MAECRWPSEHPLLAGDPDTVHEAGVLVHGRVAANDVEAAAGAAQGTRDERAAVGGPGRLNPVCYPWFVEMFILLRKRLNEAVRELGLDESGKGFERRYENHIETVTALATALPILALAQKDPSYQDNRFLHA